MRIGLNDEATEFGRVALAAIAAAGGDELIQQVESAPATRDTALDRVLGDLGAWDLDVRGSADELEAAAALCRSAGYHAAPVALAERLARPTDLDVSGGQVSALAVIAGRRPMAQMQASSLRWVGVDLDGNRSVLTARPTDLGVRTSGFVVDVDTVPIETAPLDAAGALDAQLGLVLPLWTLLGTFDRVLDLTTTYAQDRQQFGRPLAKFQSVQFQLTDAAVERAGVQELAKYALWSVAQRQPEALVDCLAARFAAVEAADVIFRIGHQLHGAIGFCDETTISWLSRASQPLRRLPLPLSGTLAELTRRMGRTPLTGLYTESAGSKAQTS